MNESASARPLLGRMLLIGLAAIALGGALAAAAERPRVGLVLGGGGARGAAHIGVLEVLREQRIPVDCVAGTSMGGLVSGAFAAGLSPDEMKTALAEANWRDMFKDNPDTSNLNSRKKYLSRRFVPGAEMGVTEEGVESLSGVLDGQKIKLFFNRLVHSEYGDPQIERLRLPLSIVSTDLVTGNKVAFRSGSLTKAMRASMSVPGLMAPVKDDSRLLVDGGLVDNVPIDEVRELCRADVVIAVNVGSPLLKPEEIGGVLSVSAQMINILTEQNVTRSLATLRPRDIYIKPDLEGITAADFERYAETAERGRVAAAAMIPRLRALSVSERQYDDWWAHVAAPRGAPPTVDAVEVAELHRVNPAYVQRHLQGYTGAPLDLARLEGDVGRVYGDGEYQNVDYSLLPTRDKNILRVTPLEKQFGPDYLRFGVHLNSLMGEESVYNLRVAYDKTWLNSFGGEWLSGVQIGNEPKVFTEFYQPLDAAQRYFIDARLAYQREQFGLYQNNDKLADYKADELRADLLAGINVGLLGPVRFGWVERRREASLDTGSPLLPEGDKRFGGWVAELDFDQFDRLYLPTQGWSAKASYFESPGEDYGKATADLRAAQHSGDYVVSGRVYAAGSPKGRLPNFDPVTLGGFLNLSGFAPDQIIGDSAYYGSVRLEKIVGQFPLGIRGDLRVGAALEAGKVDGRFTETELDGWQTSLAVYAGGETPLGPVLFGIGYAPNGSTNFYLSIGTP